MKVHIQQGNGTCITTFHFGYYESELATLVCSAHDGPPPASMSLLRGISGSALA